MPWYSYAIEFLAGALLANGVPHFVQGVSGNPFPSPFADPPGKGNSSPVVNAIWGSANLVAGALLLHFFWPRGNSAAMGWIAFGLGALFLAISMASHFGEVRAGKQ